MNTAEEYMFSSHMENINTRFEDFARECMQMQTPSALSIILTTDIHYIRKYALYLPAYYKLKEAVDFSGYIGADLLAVLGDLVDGNTTVKRQYRDLYDSIGLLKQAKATSVLLSKGNHDSCEWYAFKNELSEGNFLAAHDWYIHSVNPLRVQFPMVLDSDNIEGGYYYIDYPFQKIRVINLNTCDTAVVLDENGHLTREYCNHWRFGLSEKQLKWLVKALTFEEKGWSVIFMSHNFLFGTKEEIVSNGDTAWEIIRAFKNKTAGKAVNDEKYYEAEVGYDFTQNMSNDVLVYFFGHTHLDFDIVKDGVTAVSTANILSLAEEWDKPEKKIEGGWDFAVIDKENRILKTKRFGVENKDREIKLL